MTVFVTGGSGLVGSHVVQQLAKRGARVRALVRDDPGARLVADLGAEPVHGSVEDPESWALASGASAIVHAAAHVVKAADWAEYERVNVQGTRLAADAAAELGARLVHISSVAVYGRSPANSSGVKTAEDAPFGPIAETDFYARSKRMAEEVLWRRVEERGISAVALRPCVLYGERERIFIRRLLRLLRFGLIPLTGPGENRLAVVYAGNVADAVCRAIERPDVQGPFNVTNDGTITQREFFEIAAKALGKRVRFVRVPPAMMTGATRLVSQTLRILRPGKYGGIGSSGGRFMARENPYTSERATSELGWDPPFDAREAWERSVKWAVEQLGG